MDKPFYITDGLNKIGPFSKEEVLQMLYSSHISITDYLVDARDNRMCPLLQHEDFGGEGATHSLTGKGGIAGLSPKSLASKYGFGELRQQVHKEREEKKREKDMRSIDPKASHLNEVMQARPDLVAKEPAVKNTIPKQTKNPVPNSVVTPTASPAPTHDDDKPTFFGKPLPQLKIDEDTTTATIKSNTSTNFYLKVKDKEFGPLKFLILLSLLKQNKITLDAMTRNHLDPEWHKLSHYVPKELQQTIHISPAGNNHVLPKTQWKRKNVRLDYDEMVICHNERYSFVGKAIDLSAEGMAVLWVYDVPVNEEFELSFFDLEKNLVSIKARLARKEPLLEESDIPLHKAVFIFKERIQIKNFIS